MKDGVGLEYPPKTETPDYEKKANVVKLRASAGIPASKGINC